MSTRDREAIQPTLIPARAYALDKDPVAIVSEYPIDKIEGGNWGSIGEIAWNSGLYTSSLSIISFRSCAMATICSSKLLFIIAPVGLFGLLHVDVSCFLFVELSSKVLNDDHLGFRAYQAL